jgi:hypothetical protein
VSTEVFAEDNIKRFAAAWYLTLDVHAPEEEYVKFLADEGLEMIWPEKTVRGLDEAKVWYRGGAYSDGSEAPGVINFFFDEIHNVQSVKVEVSGDEAIVDVVVGWQASWFEPPAAKSKRTSMDATQRWTLRRCRADKNPYGLEIVHYNATVEPFKYAPGFARL